MGLDTDRGEAKELIKKLGLEDRVIGLGFRRDVPDLLNAADYFVLSSHLEGIAGALLQAMATGMVVISTSAGGISEYLRDGENGFLVPVGDKEKLLRAMERALNLSEVEYRQMGKRAMETAEGYSIERTAEGYVRLFNELLG